MADQAENSGEDRKLSFGEHGVGLSFNPSGDQTVTDIKQACARVLDTIQATKKPEGMNEFEEELWQYIHDAAVQQVIAAQMMAVKLVTFKP